MSGIKLSSFDLYNRRVRPVAGTSANAGSHFSGYLHLGNYSRAESRSPCAFSRSRRKKHARANTYSTGLSDSYVSSGCDVALSTKRRKKNKNEGKNTIIRPTDRYESVRSLAYRLYMKEKRGRENSTEGDDFLYVAHFRSENEESSTGCVNAYVGCAHVNTWLVLCAFIHDYVNCTYPSISNSITNSRIYLS